MNETDNSKPKPDDFGRIISCRTAIARVEHPCMACQGTIRPGEEYHFKTIVVDGRNCGSEDDLIVRWTYCAVCADGDQERTAIEAESHFAIIDDIMGA